MYLERGKRKCILFFASGQSNMAFLVQNAFNGSALVQDANNWPNIRLYTSKKLSSPKPLVQQPEIEEPWSVASNISISMNNKRGNGRRLDDDWLYMSAVAWLFARRIHKITEIPVGILNTNWGRIPNRVLVESRGNECMYFTTTVFTWYRI